LLNSPRCVVRGQRAGGGLNLFEALNLLLLAILENLEVGPAETVYMLARFISDYGGHLH
jgi:hypothetical protein